MTVDKKSVVKVAWNGGTRKNLMLALVHTAKASEASQALKKKELDNAKYELVLGQSSLRPSLPGTVRQSADQSGYRPLI